MSYDVCVGRVALIDRILRVHDLETQGLYSNPVQFYDFLQNRVMIIFRPKFEEVSPQNPELSIVLSKKQTYDTVRGTTILGCTDSLLVL